MADAESVALGVPYDGKEPLTFIVFGATGDLARKKLYPAFNELLRFGRLPEHILVVGYGRSDYTMESLWKKQSVKCKGTDEEKLRLFKRCRYFRGQYDSEEAFQKLDQQIVDYANELGGPDNRIFFLSIPPTIFGKVCQNVKDNCMSKKGFTRIIIEKPFGRDSESYQKLNDVTSSVFDERQLYRIDHYLGKEVIMNILSQRFVNVIFEPMWNNKYIQSVQINWQENLGTGGRGGYFDKFGIIRDIMQNHLLQVLMFIAMDRPDSLSGEDIVKKKTELLKCIPVLKPDDCILGQFTSRIFTNYGKQVIEPGYLDDETVPKDSKCPTYAAVKLDINNERWQGVPFIVKAGKGLNERFCEVRIKFKPPQGGLYDVPGNELVMRIQPDEAIYFKVQNKRPGLDMSTLDTTVMDMTYSHEFSGVRIADAYERAFLNATRADQSLFVGSSELVEAWRIFTPLLHHIDNEKPDPHLYPFGTTGPKEADAFYEKYGINPATTWENLLLSNAKDAQQLKQLFDTFAKDKEALYHDEVGALLKQFYDGRDVPQKRIEVFMRSIDMNNDGEVSWDEFQQGVAGLLAVDKTQTEDVGATSDILRNFSEQALAELARLKSMHSKGKEEDFAFLM
jgi:glucose-6-phosphate 1-dehydrogenase